MTDTANAEAEVTTDSDTLTADEQAYFESGGQKELPAEKTEEKQEEAKATEGEQAEQKAQGEQDADDGDDDGSEPLKPGEDGNKGRFVRHGAFHQEREKRKALEKQVSEYQERFARVDERLKIVNESLGKAPSHEEAKSNEMPDPEQDIFGAFKWAVSKINSLESGVTESKKASEQTTQQAELLSTYRADASAFATKQTDFGDAYKFAMEARDKELEALGYGDPAMRARMIAEEEQWIVTEAIKAKQSPSERIYNFAKVKGFRPANGEQKQEQETEANKKNAEQIEKINKGQEANKSLSSAGGSAGGEVTAATLADMSEEEFDAWMAKTPKSAQRRLFGG